MKKILILPGDGQGSEAVAAIGRIITNATDQVEVVRRDIGFPAYEKCGEYLPYDVLDLVSQCRIVICGPTADYGDGDASRNPLHMLSSQLGLFGRSRRLRTIGLTDGGGIDITIWGTNMKRDVDISETRGVDGVTISKYIRSAFYTRMMSAALTDMELCGGTKATCLGREDLFPDSTRLFYDSFEALFGIDGVDASTMNFCDWIEDLRNRPNHEYLIVADLYLMVAESAVSGLTGGESLSPVKYVGEYSNEEGSLILPRPFEDTVDPISCVSSASTALADLGMMEESRHILEVLDRTVAGGDRPPSMGGTMGPLEFIDLVASRI